MEIDPDGHGGVDPFNVTCTLDGEKGLHLNFLTN